MIRSFSALCASVLLATASFSHATLIGYETPVWSADSIVWDSFTSAPGPGGSRTYGRFSTGGGTGYLSVTAGLTSAPGSGNPPMQTLGPDLIYTGGVTNVWSIALRAGAATTQISLQIKEQTNEQTLTPISSYLSPTISGISPGTPTVISFTESDLPYNIVTYTWTGLSLAANDFFSIQFSGAGNGHRVIDGFQVNSDGVLAVPEPSSALLLGVGAGIFFLKRRRSLHA